MTKERYWQIKNEAERRLKIWLEHESFDSITCDGSFIRFNMSLGMLGYPFEKEKWMEENDFEKFITDDEFYNPKYDELMTDLFYEYWK